MVTVWSPKLIVWTRESGVAERGRRRQRLAARVAHVPRDLMISWYGCMKLNAGEGIPLQPCGVKFLKHWLEAIFMPESLLEGRPGRGKPAAAVVFCPDANR